MCVCKRACLSVCLCACVCVSLSLFLCVNRCLHASSTHAAAGQWHMPCANVSTLSFSFSFSFSFAFCFSFSFELQVYNVEGSQIYDDAETMLAEFEQVFEEQMAKVCTGNKEKRVEGEGERG